MSNDTMEIEVYRQHYEQFRDLNGHMWKIPMLALTLTGGLWFGVDKVQGSILVQSLLLLLAILSNIGLVFVLHRIRYVMKLILEKLKEMAPKDFVDASGEGCFCYRKNMVILVFSSLLLCSSLFSFIYLLVILVPCLCG